MIEEVLYLHGIGRIPQGDLQRLAVRVGLIDLLAEQRHQGCDSTDELDARCERHVFSQFLEGYDTKLQNADANVFRSSCRLVF